MRIPVNYTESEVLATIDKVIKPLSRKFAFGIYSPEDIIQEGFLLACKLLEKYDGSAPLENFLRKALPNELKNFKRDNSYRINESCTNCNSFNEECIACCRRQQTQDIKRNLLNPIDIYLIHEGRATTYEGSLIDTLEAVEIVDKINRHLPVEYRKDYLRIKDGLYVPKSQRLEIEQIIIDIMEQNDE